MAKTVYIDWDVGTDTGTGTTGDPYGNILYALAQEDATADDVTYKVRGSTVTSYDEGAEITIATTANTSVIIEPDTGYGWSAGDPQLTIYSATAYRNTVKLNQTGVTVRGFRVDNRRNGSGERSSLVFGSGCDSTCIVEGVKAYANGSTITLENGGDDYGTVRNSLLSVYSDNEADGSIINVSSYTNVRLYNNVLSCGGGNGVSISATGDETNTEIKNNVFLDCATELNLAVTQGNNATDEGTAPTNLSGAVTSIVTGDFQNGDIANPQTGNSDYRLATGSALEDVGATITSFSDDVEGTSRPQGSNWDIGYHELAAASGSTGTGTPAAQEAQATGSGAIGRSGTGTPAAQAAVVVATGVVGRSGTGAPAAQVSAVVGVGVASGDVSLVLTVAANQELKDAGGTVWVSLANIVWEWYDTPGSTAGEPLDSGTFSTNVTGEATIVVNGSDLANGQYGQLILYHPSDPDIRATLRIPVVK